MSLLLMGTGKAVDGSASAWTPASTSLAAWYDISDMSTLFKDTAGTIPVTADNDIIKRINDKSGSGLHLKAQNGIGFAYKANAGKPYMAVDGTAGEFFSADTPVVMTNGSGEWSVVVAHHHPTTFGGNMFQTTGMDNSLFSQSSGSPLARAFDASGNGLITDFDFSHTIPTTPNVWMAVVSTTNIEVFLNNLTDGPTAISSALFNASQKPAFLWAAGGPSDQRFYGLWVSKQVYDSTTRGNAQTYGAGKF